MAVRIGTSGFIYEHWRGRFYPPSARGTELERYAQAFDTVELNVTFYRTPPASTFRSWASRVPAGFLFAVKASRYLTHVRRLKEPRGSVQLLLERASELGPHLGPILVQLPPDLELDLGTLEGALDAFPAGVRVAVEPRHASWFVEETRALLAERNVALCVADRRGPIAPLWRTADWTYLRFHAGTARPSSCYDPGAIDEWAGRIEAFAPDATCFAYFNNDGHGCALRDAEALGRALERRGIGVGRLPVVPEDVVRDAPPEDAAPRPGVGPNAPSVPCVSAGSPRRRGARPAPGPRPGRPTT
jgi:uncharacterized protein YecE (DUF72 family)